MVDGWLVVVKTSQFEGLFHCKGERLEAFLKFRSGRPRMASGLFLRASEAEKPKVMFSVERAEK